MYIHPVYAKTLRYIDLMSWQQIVTLLVLEKECVLCTKMVVWCVIRHLFGVYSPVIHVGALRFVVVQ